MTALTSMTAWPATYTCDVSSASDVELAAATEAATTLLWALSGRRWGAHTTIGEAFYVSSCESTNRTWLLPIEFSQNSWTPIGCGGHCCRVYLPRRPVRAVAEVRVDGVALDPAAYSLTRDVLTLDVCPACSGCDDCGPPSIEVDYSWGQPPPASVGYAVGELACEFLAGMNGQTCRLSSRATSITRQGVTIDLDDATTLYREGLTGMPIADAWLRAVNPNRLQMPSRVVPIDGPRPL